MDVRTVRGHKVSETQRAFPIRKLENGGHAGGLVRSIVEVTRLEIQGLRCGRGRSSGRETLVNPLIYEQPFGTERIPGNSTGNYNCKNQEFALTHGKSSLKMSVS